MKETVLFDSRYLYDEENIKEYRENLIGNDYEGDTSDDRIREMLNVDFWEFTWEDFKSELSEKCSKGLVSSGHCKCWDGTFAGGRIFKDAEDFFSVFTKNMLDVRAVIEEEDSDRRLVMTSYNHDGHISMAVYSLTEEGEAVADENDWKCAKPLIDAIIEPPYAACPISL